MSVYLIHFSEPIGDTSKPHGAAQHYVGYAEREDPASRIEAHRRGRGARITAAAVENGCDLYLARVWPDGDRDLERWIKRQKKHARFCPLCSPND